MSNSSGASTTLPPTHSGGMTALESAAIFTKVQELHTRVVDCAIEVPESWHHKAVARFTGEIDEGDGSVGLAPEWVWVLAANQTGTILADILAQQTAVTELIEALKAERKLQRDGVVDFRLPAAARRVQAALCALEELRACSRGG